MSKTLGYDLDYFLNSPRQTATKRLGHKKFWNVVVHAIVSWGIAWATLVIGKMFLPFYLQVLLIIFKLLICIVTEPPLGFAYSVLYCLVVYHALLVQTSVTFLQAFMLIALCFGIQIVGHLIFEHGLPPERPTKGEGLLFHALDLANEFFMAEFHFAILFFMRIDLLPVLKWRSDVELKKAMDKIMEIKTGKRAP